MNKPTRREGFVVDEPKVVDVPEPEQREPERREPEEPVETWPITVRLLHRAIRDNKGEEVREMVFREPSAGDINRYGNPVRVNQEGDPIIDERKMTFVMAALSGILPPLIDRMDPRDWNSCAYRLRGFFLPEAAAW